MKKFRQDWNQAERNNKTFSNFFDDVLKSKNIDNLSIKELDSLIDDISLFAEKINKASKVKSGLKNVAPISNKLKNVTKKLLNKRYGELIDKNKQYSKYLKERDKDDNFEYNQRFHKSILEDITKNLR